MGKKQAEDKPPSKRPEWLEGIKSPPQWWDGVKGSVRSLGERFPQKRTEKDLSKDRTEKPGSKEPSEKSSARDRPARKERPKSGVIGDLGDSSFWASDGERTKGFRIRIKVDGIGSSPNLNTVPVPDRTEAAPDGSVAMPVPDRTDAVPDGSVWARRVTLRNPRRKDKVDPSRDTEQLGWDQEVQLRNRASTVQGTMLNSAEAVEEREGTVRDRFSFILPRVDRLGSTVRSVRKDFGRLRSKSCDRILKRHKPRSSGQNGANDRLTDTATNDRLTDLAAELDEAYFQLNSIMRRSRRLQEKRSPYTGPYVGLAHAKVDYVPSPYDTEGLPFKAGDLIHIISRRASGIWLGEVGGRTGNFKFINVEEVEAPNRNGLNSTEATTVTGMLCKLDLAHLTSRLILNGWDNLPKLQRISRMDLEYLGVEDTIEQDKLLAALALRMEDRLLERVDSGYSDGLDSESTRSSTYSDEMTRSSTYSDEITRSSTYSDEITRSSTCSDRLTRSSTYSDEVTRSSTCSDRLKRSSTCSENSICPSTSSEQSTEKFVSTPSSSKTSTNCSSDLIQSPINSSDLHSPFESSELPRCSKDLPRNKDDLPRSCSLSSIHQSTGESNSTLVSDENLPISSNKSSKSSSVMNLNRLDNPVMDSKSCSVDNLDETPRRFRTGSRATDYSVKFAKTLLFFSDDPEAAAMAERRPKSGSVTASRLSIAEPTNLLNKSF